MKKSIVAFCLMLLASGGPTALAGADTAIPEGTVTSGTPQGYLATLNKTQGIMVRDIVQILRGGKTMATAIVSRVTDYDCTLIVTDPIGATLRKGDAVRFVKHGSTVAAKTPPRQSTPQPPGPAAVQASQAPPPQSSAGGFYGSIISATVLRPPTPRGSSLSAIADVVSSGPPTVENKSVRYEERYITGRGSVSFPFTDVTISFAVENKGGADAPRVDLQIPAFEDPSVGGITHLGPGEIRQVTVHGTINGALDGFTDLSVHISLTQ